MLPPNVPSFPRQSPYDPFTEPVNSAFTGWRQPSSNTSMADFSSTRSSSIRQPSDPMKLCSGNTTPSIDMETASAYESLIQSLQPRAPTNTPQNKADTPGMVTTERKPSDQVMAEATPSEFQLRVEQCNCYTHILSNSNSQTGWSFCRHFSEQCQKQK
jgi:hypothetical protein